MMNQPNGYRNGCTVLLTTFVAVAGIGSDRAPAPATGQAEMEPLKGLLHLRAEDLEGTVVPLFSCKEDRSRHHPREARS